jgi:hypothetical protein
VRCNTPLPATAGPRGAAAVPGLLTRPTTAAAAADRASASTNAAAGPAPPGRMTGSAAAEPAGVPGMAARPGSGGPVADPTEGSKRIGPGLSAAAPGGPGSSRAQAAAVQPPGYGLDAGGAEPPPPPPDPRDDPRVARRVALAGALLVAAVLAAGGVLRWLTRPAYLDSAAVQRQLSDQVTARLGGPVAVACPGDQRRESGVTFRCSATDSAGGRRTVTVTVVDNSGKYTWALGTA